MPTPTIFHVAIVSRQGQHLGVIPIDIRGGEHSVLRKPQNRTFGTISQGFAGRAK